MFGAFKFGQSKFGESPTLEAKATLGPVQVDTSGGGRDVVRWRWVPFPHLKPRLRPTPQPQIVQHNAEALAATLGAVATVGRVTVSAQVSADLRVQQAGALAEIAPVFVYTSRSQPATVQVSLGQAKADLGAASVRAVRNPTDDELLLLLSL